MRGIKELSESDIYYTSDRGPKYAFNTAERLNNLMLDMLLQTPMSAFIRQIRSSEFFVGWLIGAYLLTVAGWTAALFRKKSFV